MLTQGFTQMQTQWASPSPVRVDGRKKGPLELPCISQRSVLDKSKESILDDSFRPPLRANLFDTMMI